MWLLDMGTVEMPGPSRPTDRMEWKTIGAQTKAWIYVNLENAQHNHIKQEFGHRACDVGGICRKCTVHLVSED